MQSYHGSHFLCCLCYAVFFYLLRASYMNCARKLLDEEVFTYCVKRCIDGSKPLFLLSRYFIALYPVGSHSLTLTHPIFASHHLRYCFYVYNFRHIMTNYATNESFRPISRSLINTSHNTNKLSDSRFHCYKTY